MSQSKAATRELSALDPFEGVWDTEGLVYTDPSAEPSVFHAVDTYEWLPGGFFLLHRFDADMPDGKMQGIEIIGGENDGKTYSMHSYDNRGGTGRMRAHVRGKAWIFQGDGIRFSGTFAKHGDTFTGTWELQDGENWLRWMDVTLKKRPTGGGIK